MILCTLSSIIVIVVRRAEYSWRNNSAAYSSVPQETVTQKKYALTLMGLRHSTSMSYTATLIPNRQDSSGVEGLTNNNNNNIFSQISDSHYTSSWLIQHIYYNITSIWWWWLMFYRHFCAHGRLKWPNDLQRLWSEVKDETTFRYASAEIRTRVVLICGQTRYR